MPPKTKVAFDLDAVEIEATGTPFSFRFGGQVFILPRQDELDSDLLALLGSETQLKEAVLTALGPDQAAELRKHTMTIGQLTALITAWGEHNGADAGESSGSEAS